MLVISDKFAKVKFTVPGGGRKYRIRHKMPTVRFRPRMTDSQNQEVAMPPLNMAPLGKKLPLHINIVNDLPNNT